MIPPAAAYPVTTVDDAYQACHPEIPLEPGDGRYVDLTPVRGGFGVATVVSDRIRRTRPPLFHQQLLTGHRGSGKSTELKQLQASLRQDGYFAVYADVEEVLDLGDISYLDVLLVVARAIDQELREQGIALSKRLLEDLDRWFAEIILTEEQRKDITATLRTEFAVEPTVPLLARMLASVTGQIRSGSSRKTEIRRTLERELRVFLQRLNDLIADARLRLARKKWKDLVVIVDGLEKVPWNTLPEGRTTHSALFVDHAEQLKAPQCHIVYTVPISLVFNFNLGDAFADPPIVLPMVKVDREDGAPHEAGRAALFEVVARRVEVEQVFENPACLERLVETSGGVVRDLMRLVRLSCDGAEKRITGGHVAQAVNSLVLQYGRLIKDEHRERLIQIARERRAPNDEESGWLLWHRLVLEYQDDQRWADLHPAVKLSPQLRAWLNLES